MAYAPTLTAQTDFEPVPRVEIVFSTVPADAVTATVYRITSERTYAVQGGIRKAAAGGFSLVDFAIVPQLSTSYRAEFYDTDGTSLGLGDSTAATLDYTGTIIQNPIDPTRNVVVEVLDGTATGLSRPMRGGIVEVSGREVPPFIGQGRSALRDVPVRFMTSTLAGETAMESLFGGYGDVKQVPVVCVRTSLNLGLPRPFFAAVTDPRKELFRAYGDESVVWPWTVDEAAPPAAALITPLLTYADFEAVYATYADFEAAYATYLEAESDFSIAGSA